ncbi:MAG: hypothetical protein KDB80_03155 [Planctomycetes bacterium]|nr:hypothetical protein [Planctomycetota bacterium]
MVERREMLDADLDACAHALRPEELPCRNRGLANTACIIGGVLGTVAWVAVAGLVGEEYGIVALLVGGLVGGACVLAGGRGNRMAVVAALFAFVSIVGGKLASAERAIAAEFAAERSRDERASMITFDEWSAGEAASRTVRRRVLYNLHGFDMLFGALGVALAFTLVMRASRVDVARLQSRS